MNEKINLQDLATLLAEKAGITKKEAETFLREYSEIMSDGLINDKSLKIKDLGSFKLTLVEDRESVDVATGERVLIPAHYKVSFSADKNLAQIVNEPFAFFETVEINDDAIVDEPEDFSENEQEEETVEIVAKPEETEEKNTEAPINEKFDNKEDIVCESAGEKPFEEKEEESEENMKKKRKTFLISILILLLFSSLIAGIFYCSERNDDPQQVIVGPVSKPEIQIEKTDSLAISGDTVTTELPKAETEEVTEVKEAKPPVNKKRTISKGERLTLIALEEYGNKIFWVYLYEENKDIIKNPDIVPPGLTIQIPPVSKYNIDKNDQKSINKAQTLIDSYKSRK
jgi:nucleoid DNA-binding protein/nucleoid-associated protein YgaU